MELKKFKGRQPMRYGLKPTLTKDLPELSVAKMTLLE